LTNLDNFRNDLHELILIFGATIASEASIRIETSCFNTI